MGLFSRQFVLASAVLAAAMLFGGVQAQAGYVSIATMAENEGRSLVPHSPVSPLNDIETAASMGGSFEASQSRPGTNFPHAPSEPVPLSPKLPYAAHNFGQGSGPSSSSSSAPGNGPSTAPADNLPRPQVLSPEIGSLLPPQTSESHPFSVASFLFRPPRAT